MFKLRTSLSRRAHIAMATVVVVVGAANALTVAVVRADDLLAVAADDTGTIASTPPAKAGPVGGGDGGSLMQRFPAFVGAGAVERMKTVITNFWLVPSDGFASFTRAVGSNIGTDATTGGDARLPAGSPSGPAHGSRPSDLALTLNDARRDAGEVRALSDEVRLRADELSQRFSIGAWAMGSAAAARATITPEMPGNVAAAQVMNAPAQPTARAGADNNPFRDLIDSLLAPPSKAPDFSNQMALGNTPSVHKQPTTTAHMMAATHAVAESSPSSTLTTQPPQPTPSKPLAASLLAPQSTPLPSRPRRPKSASTGVIAKPAVAATAATGKSAGR